MTGLSNADTGGKASQMLDVDRARCTCYWTEIRQILYDFIADHSENMFIIGLVRNGNEWIWAGKVAVYSNWGLDEPSGNGFFSALQGADHKINWYSMGAFDPIGGSICEKNVSP